MNRTLRFLMALLAGLAVLTLAGAAVVQKTTRQWFDEDIALRVRLIATGAGSALLQHWSDPDKSPLERLLSDIARDERIMATAACAPDATLLPSTQDSAPVSPPSDGQRFSFGFKAARRFFAQHSSLCWEQSGRSSP